MTNINDYLKILWSNIALPVCGSCGIELRCYPAKELAQLLCDWLPLKPDRTFLICANLSLLAAPSAPQKSKARKPAKKSKPSTAPSIVSAAKTIEELASLGLSGILDPTSGQILQLEDAASLPRFSGEKVLVVLDRVRGGAAPSTEAKKRFRDSIEQAYHLGAHRFASGARGLQLCSIVEIPSATKSPRRFLQVLNGPHPANVRPPPYRVHEFSPMFRCEQGTLNLAPARPSLFSFNHPIGACPECKGFGKILAVDISRCVPNPTLSIRETSRSILHGKIFLKRTEIKLFPLKPRTTGE